ncbi:DNA-directed RNA polymerase subunit delta [Levilactobacillus parabrevis]|uniref:Probable DNA-directed RNA polymerase subunit delta n=1 Tax=Levilactobacillus parabrevis ATCC 53295 TaxID=1267003 RepID=A0A0R1GT88_9LACO|nr:DNA-directed RNA polymerase subunit delta [Levilactobacillus parabrevis]KRK36952.1 DNA-directed RNA polymerase subunit delta [Levilactobacillus parabrevis ATCC 53295]KRO06185.1 DNA-directed RNA polymerase subunit delta [Levilactobacillus parabrevis]MCT4486983.1 DNA-directed RNA polymerase subunit delta [Levilactobacillus parabrevis]MCT4489847.1 DNA-directed RNA polymerase subunit delta [Levilactobacillus parabrevis]
MELKVFEGQNKKELSMIEVAHAILSQHGDVMAFADLANAVQAYLGDSDAEVRDRLSQFYTDLNVDGSFISLGDNLWGLRTWYPFESIDEATVHAEEDEDQPKRKKRKKVNAFLADTTDDDDVIDYDDDDPEDDDTTTYATDDDDDDSATGSGPDLGKLQTGLGIDDDDEEDDTEDIPDGIEDQLSQMEAPDDDDTDNLDFSADDDEADDDDDDDEEQK